MRSRPAKRSKTDASSTRLTSQALEHEVEEPFRVPGLLVTNHHFKVPLSYSEDIGQITIFAREVTSVAKCRQSLPYLLYLQGGPGFEAPRPLSDGNGWLKSAVNNFHIVLLDQRGTGRSSPITPSNLVQRGTPAKQAAYLTHFRADNIVRDCEAVRKALVPADCNGGRWSIMGQSFGGFCAVSYLSFAPEGLSEVLLTGGLPPNVTVACAAEAAYKALYERVLAQNQKYYARYPGDAEIVRRVVLHLASQPSGGVRLPSGTHLTPRALQLLGLSGLGSWGGFEKLHYIFELAFDGDELSPHFIKAFEASMQWDTNPLYALLHEACYSQGPATNWTAHRVREEHFKDEFDAVAQAQRGEAVMFTGEMVYPWMFDDFAALKPLKPAADLIAAMDDWCELYDVQTLNNNNVPVAAATYCEDMYVEYALAQDTAKQIRGALQWMTNEYMHSGIRDNGVHIFDRLINMVRGGILLF